MRTAWLDLCSVLIDDPRFLGIDSSVAPLGGGEGSLARLAQLWYASVGRSMLSDFYLQLAAFIRRENPRPVGLCGLMLPCLEDHLLARSYEQGNSI